MIAARRTGYRHLATLLAVNVLALAVSGQSVARPEPPDWFAGDAHVHRGIGCGRENEKEMLTSSQLLDMMKVNNLAVISVLSDIGNGELKYVEKDLPLMTGKDNPVSTPERILHWDAEWHYDPDGVTFARKVIGGHLILLGLKQGGQPFAHYTYPILDWARKIGGIGGFAHMQYLPNAFYPPPDGLLHSLDCCSPLEFPVETALGMSSFLMEDVHGSDTALQAWYKILNTGFRPGLVASTDYSCNYLEPLGTLLTYVQVPAGKLTYDKWIQGIAEGRTVVSRVGHSEFLGLTVQGTSTPGDEVALSAKGLVKVRIEWTSLKPAIGRIELVQNGAVVASKTAEAAPGKPAVFETTVDVRQSGWLAARRMDWQSGHQTQTGAVFLLVAGQPVRASASDADFFVQWIDNLIKQTSAGGPWSSYLADEGDAAQARYREARTIFLRRKQEALVQANQVESGK